MTEDEDPGAGRRRNLSRGTGRAARAVLPAAAVLAAAAVATIVLSDDVRWLRLGVVAALWAALAAVWALVRRPAADDAEGLRATYELELAAEVDARQAHEMTVERDVRRELEAERGDEIDALRAEIGRLRGALEHRDAVGSAHGTRLRVVGGSSLPGTAHPDRPDAAYPDTAYPDAAYPDAARPGGGYSAAVADLRTAAIPSPTRSPGSPPHGTAAPAPRPGAGSTGAPAARGAGVNGRTVAELLAAHAGTPRPDVGARTVGGRRRRDR